MEKLNRVCCFFPSAWQVPAGQAAHVGVRPGAEGKVYRLQRELGRGARGAYVLVGVSYAFVVLLNVERMRRSLLLCLW